MEDDKEAVKRVKDIEEAMQDLTNYCNARITIVIIQEGEDPLTKSFNPQEIVKGAV